MSSDQPYYTTVPNGFALKYRVLGTYSNGSTVRTQAHCRDGKTFARYVQAASGNHCLSYGPFTISRLVPLEVNSERGLVKLLADQDFLMAVRDATNEALAEIERLLLTSDEPVPPLAEEPG